MLSAGTTEVIITPPIGGELAGYGPDRQRSATAIHQHLRAQALVLDDGKTRIALLTADLMGVTQDFSNRVRQGIYERTGILPQHITLACSHSHTAPGIDVTPPEFGATDQDYAHRVARHLIGAVVAAVKQLQPVHLYAGEGEHQHLPFDRLLQLALPP